MVHDNNNGNQTVHQFVSTPTFTSPATNCMQKFFIKFIVGNISVCYGWRNRYTKNPKPPDDLCLQTEEWRQFTPPGSVVPQTHWSNTYYHLHVHCVRLKWPMFNSQAQVIVEEGIKSHLLDSHRQKIFKELGVTC